MRLFLTLWFFYFVLSCGPVIENSTRKTFLRNIGWAWLATFLLALLSLCFPAPG